MVLPVWLRLCPEEKKLENKTSTTALKVPGRSLSRVLVEPNPVWLPWSDEKGYVLDGMAVVLSHPLWSYRNHVKNPTCLSIRSWLAMQRSQSQTAVQQCSTRFVIHSWSWSATCSASALCPEQNNSLDCGVYKMWHSCMMLGVGIESIADWWHDTQFGHCNRAGQQLDQSFRS